MATPLQFKSGEFFDNEITTNTKDSPLGRRLSANRWQSMWQGCACMPRGQYAAVCEQWDKGTEGGGVPQDGDAIRLRAYLPPPPFF